MIKKTKGMDVPMCIYNGYESHETLKFLVVGLILYDNVPTLQPNVKCDNLNNFCCVIVKFVDVLSGN